MTYAIGDIHGCRVSLETLIDNLPLTSDDQLIFMGDYIDRGPDSKGVVEYLLGLSAGYNVVHLIGNHEVFLRDAYSSPEVLDFFTSDLVGGKETLASYGGGIDHIPESHRRFLLQDSQYYHETQTHIFVHGGLEAGIALNHQPEQVLVSKRFTDPRPHTSGKIMICGHTIQKDTPVNYQGHSICIDTGSFRPDGWITALEVETNHYHQTNENGHYRQGTLACPS